ncbi:MAG TPA: TIGR03435 family protein [Terracidiphilus sp.]|jgi:uncharacterized protein (TIGR03435 family)
MKPSIRCFISLMSVCLFIPQLFAQTASGRPSFEVATIKPAAPLDMTKLAADVQAGKMPKLGPQVNGDRADYTYMSLRDLIVIAYRVKRFQITGPSWLASERFDIVATLPEGASKDNVPDMLQNLLAERFKVVTHTEQQEHKVLALVVGRGGPKMKESPAAPQPIDENAPLKPGEMKIDSPDGPIRISRNGDGSTTMNMGAKGTIKQSLDVQNKTLHLESSTVTMSGFADMLTAFMQMSGNPMQVVDRTELQGNYQISVEIALSDLMAGVREMGLDVPAPPPSAASNSLASDPEGGSTLIGSVQRMGLKFEERKVPVQQLVIDHIEKTPTEN